jgi:hypothetical protein
MHPHDLLLPETRAVAVTTFSFPQSHRHSQAAPPFGALTARSFTVQSVNRLPVWSGPFNFFGFFRRISAKSAFFIRVQSMH